MDILFLLLQVHFTTRQKNIQRDIEVNQKLQSEGWLVIRFWGKEIKKDVSACADLVVKRLEER